jgi:hypothetical protein
MDNLPVKNRGGRPKGVRDYLPAVIDFARKRKLLASTYQALDLGDKTGDYTRFNARLRLLEVTLRAAGRPRDSGGNTAFTLSIFGLTPRGIRGEVIEYTPVELGDGGDDGEE